MTKKDGTRGAAYSGDTLGDRMKHYERAETSRLLMPCLPIVVRIDGRAFHSFTKGLKKPWDNGLMDAMEQTTEALVSETHARIGYTQSDEISLIIHNDAFLSEPYFNRKIFKITSILAALASTTFDRLIPDYIPSKVGRPPALFDCRVWNVPNKEEAVNYLIWREQDAVRNSIQMAAQSMFSHAQLQARNVSELQEMMFTKHGVNWNDYPDRCKRGRYVRRYAKRVKLSPETISKLPKKEYEALSPDFMATRHVVGPIQLPILTKIANRVGVIFEDEDIVFRKPE